MASIDNHWYTCNSVDAFNSMTSPPPWIDLNANLGGVMFGPSSLYVSLIGHQPRPIFELRPGPNSTRFYTERPKGGSEREETLVLASQSHLH